ncbi:MAG: branched-chain amino acid ABC transporter substrate-binding protein [Bradyrhizobiaceae bacterium]|nr:branched-chain amino acid ABC transporter substrate-binding protein [Hyphomicrobiales bacterium]MBV9428945.1 branched-chain amino acid ABC transporter substrate-binding protein [Bradyrhizobiaceae bacterium]
MSHRSRLVAPVVLAALLAVSAAGSAAAQLAGQEIHIGVGGPLTTPSATFGTEMRQAVDLAVAERNAAGGILGARVVAVAADDQADNQKGAAVAKGFCDDPADLGVVGHVNSGVTIAAEPVYGGCGLAMITPMSSSPGVTEQGHANVFRLTNRDDRKGPSLAKWLNANLGKRRAVVLDDGTTYGKGLSDGFVQGFEGAGAAVVTRESVKQGDTDFRSLLGRLPKDFDLVFFAGIREGAYIVKDMRALGMSQLFACGDGCWSVDGFIKPAGDAATAGEGVRILSAAPAIGKVPGSTDFAARYTAKYGPINNYAASSYDTGRIVMAAIEQAAKAKNALPTRADVVAAVRANKFQGIAYARPVEWDAKGDNKSAVIFVNVVEDHRFKEIDEIGGP